MSDPKESVVLAPVGIPSEAFVGTIRSAQMSDFSGTMYRTARSLALECSPTAPLGDARTAFPMAIVTLACTALESFVNEQVELEATSGSKAAGARVLRSKLHPPKPGAGKPQRMPSSRSVWRKYLALHGKSFKESADPYSAFNELVELRNLIVHRAARFYGPHELPEEAAPLRGRFTFTPSADGSFIAWDQQALNAECARWACNTAVAIRAEHWRLVGRPEVPRWEPLPEP